MGVPFEQYCFWTDERVQMLKELWAEGHTAANCMDKINEATNGTYSENAVIGKVNRLGLEREPNEKKAHPWGRSGKRGKKNSKISKEVIDLFTADANGKNHVPNMRPCGVLELTEDKCKYPIGDPRSNGFFFCGALPASGVHYCAAHAARCYSKPSDRRR